MALPEIFPTKIDVGGSLLGRKFTEDKWEEVFGAMHVPFVVTGLGQQALSGLNFTVEAGTAVIGGFRVKFAQTLIALPASQNDVTLWLKLMKDGNGDINDAQLEAKTDFIVPAHPAMVLRFFKTGASSVTENEDRRSRRGTSFATKYNGNGNAGRKLMVGFRPQKITICELETNNTLTNVYANPFGSADDLRQSIEDTGAGTMDMNTATGTFLEDGRIDIQALGANVSAIVYRLVAS